MDEGVSVKLEKYLESLPAGRKIVFIDEMPWMDTPRSNFISGLEHFWNSWASWRDDIKLIVCGSAASWIINNLIRNMPRYESFDAAHRLDHVQTVIEQSLNLASIVTQSPRYTESPNGERLAELRDIIRDKDRMREVFERQWEELQT